MNADVFRHLYDYHFAENRKLWDNCVAQLPDEQFAQGVGYSHGSVRGQLAHLMGVDEAWFGDLGAVDSAGQPDPAELDRPGMRARWDAIERQMRAYLARLSDAMLSQKPFAEGEDKDLILWQVLFQVLNHGTDHRAQLLRLLSDLGVKTSYQDYIFYAYDNPAA